MPTHAEKRELPYTAEQLYDLVADVDRYPEFLPWCVAARVMRREGNVLYADLVIGFRMFRERFTSTATLYPHHRVDVEYIKGPFRHLNNHWVFTPAGKDRCVIDFYIDFEFRSRLLQRAMEPLFNEAVRRMVTSFETRARRLYGRPERAAPTAAPDAYDKA
jgi:coenzyme Q-binding protein COQ10